MRKPLRGGALMMLAAMMATAGNDHYALRRPAEIKPRDNTRAKKLYKVDYQEHEFVIHCETIMAKNRKTALKIYANRHKSEVHK